MANPYYTNAFAGQPGQTARAEDVSGQFQAVQAGFDGVLASVNHAIIAPAADPTLNLLPVAASRANQWLRFDANGQPLTVNAPFNWRGLWAPTTQYYVGDVVQIGTHQNLMYCTTQHVSAANYPADATNWSTFIDLTGIQWWNYYIVNSAGTTNLAVGDSVFVDSSGGNIILQLPTGVLGQSPINITHVAGSLGTGQTITIQSAAGQFIMGNSQNQVTVDVVNASMSLAYCNATLGWRLRTMG